MKKPSHIILVGLLIRALLIPFSSQGNDMAFFYQAVIDGYRGFGPYASMFFTYPSLWFLIFSPLFWLYGAFFSPDVLGVYVPGLSRLALETQVVSETVTSPIFNLLEKLPIVIGEVLLGLLLWQIAKRWKDKKTALRVLKMWFWNPLVIMVSSVHGQFDAWPALLVLAAFFLITSKRFFEAGIGLALAIFLKVYPIYFLPLYLIVGILPQLPRSRVLKERLRPLWQFGLGILVVSVLGVAFLIRLHGFEGVFRRGETLGMEGSLNIWFFTNLYPIGKLVSSFDFRMMARAYFLILGVFWAIFAPMAVAVSPQSLKEKLLSGHLLILPLVLLTFPLTNPQYLVWLIPFLILRVVGRKGLEWAYRYLWLAGLGFYFALLSFNPLGYLLPLGIYTKILPLSYLIERISATRRLPGFFSPYLFADLMFLCGLAVVLSLLKILKDEIKIIWRSSST